MARPPRVDPVQAHLDAYPYTQGDTTETSDLIVHMRDGHREDHARWIIGPGGDLLDHHYSAHGRLTTDMMVDAAVARHPAGKKRST
jgi:hypothetical protein